MHKVIMGTLAATQILTGTSAMAEAVNLKCEYLVNPMGIDVPRPRLYWQMKSDRRGSSQTAYQVLVSSSPEPADGKADVWDSGRVESDQSAHIEYGGPALKSRARYYWAVRIWDEDGKAYALSQPAFWEMGLLSPDDWKAKWIGTDYAKDPRIVDVNGMDWIWFPEGDPIKDAPPGTRYFKTTFEVPAEGKLTSATLHVIGDNNYHAFINGKQVLRNGGGWQSINPVEVENEIKPGSNLIAVSCKNANGPAGVAALLVLKYEDGKVVRITTGDSWKSANKKLPDWEKKAETGEPWKQAKRLCAVGEGPWGLPWTAEAGGPASILRKEFNAGKEIKDARVYVTALGTYRLHINGKRVGEDILTPDWTDYRKRVLYQTYDVTGLLKQGDNAIAAMVGDGWYASGLGWGLQRFCFGAPPLRLLLQMHVTYADGSSEIVATDESWKAGQSPILRSEIYAGETYDARLEQKGWDTPGFDDKNWKSVKTPETSASINVAAQHSPTIQVTEEIKPVSITSPEDGVYIFDMGQNMVGWCRLKVKGPKGTSVRLRHAEILKPDGEIYTDNLRKAEATDTYVLKGEGEEVFEPHFTYHGFRYVEVSGYPGKPDMDAITGRVFHTAGAFSGHMDTSSDLVDKIWLNTLWGQRGNLHSVPTDCPQRDERLGWTGDAQAFWATACFNMDLAAFSHKWTKDLVEAQSEVGGFPNVAPRVISLEEGAPGWGDAGVIVPYTAYRQYGDKRIIEVNWDAMEKWMEYIHAENPDYLWMKRRGNDYGDWVPANSETDKGLIATAYWAYDARLMSEMASAIGREDAAKKYADLHSKISEAFRKKFIHSDGTFANGSQTCYVLPLHMVTLSEEEKTSAVALLVRDIMETRKGFLSTGFLGSTYLMPVLSNYGHDDVAYKLLFNEEYPSWGYMIRKGATTIWERWNGDKGDPGMNSYNHYCYGAVSEWMYKYVAGIDSATTVPGFKSMVIKPHIDARLKTARGEYDSLYGKIVSEWSRDDSGKLDLNVTIPANTTAEIHVPTADAEKVSEVGVDGKALQPARVEPGYAVYAVGGGRYSFRSQL